MMGGAALVVVLVVLAIGFHRLGPRGYQRAFMADERRIEDLRSIAQAVYYRRQAPMPATLGELPQSARLSLNDPVTRAPYEYHPKSGTAYELCATFATETGAQTETDMPPHDRFWSHSKGRYCYEADSNKMPDW
jgi:hypothetical protein